jgi:hypothetical protein
VYYKVEDLANKHIQKLEARNTQAFLEKELQEEKKIEDF